MTELQNTSTPVAPPLTNHFHTVPYWTQTECLSRSLVGQLGVLLIYELLYCRCWMYWNLCGSLVGVGVTWNANGSKFGVLGSTPAHSWLLNHHTVFWKSDGHTEINRARWRAPVAQWACGSTQCVEAGSVVGQSDHVAAWWTSHRALTVPSSLTLIWILQDITTTFS